MTKGIALFFLGILFFDGLSALAIDTPNQVLKVDSIWHNGDRGFEENRGQLKDLNGKPVPFVLFKAESPGLQVYVTEKGLSYVFAEFKKENSVTHLHQFRIDEELKGASILKQNIELLEKSGDSYSNYFLPNCNKGIYEVFKYKKIRIRNIYPGINWLLYFNEKGIKYEFEVGSHVNPNVINMVFHGGKIILTSQGDLNLSCRMGEFREQRPVSYQFGEKISSQFELKDDSTVHFILDRYLEKEPLLIDPQLVWGTFFGGIGEEALLSIHSDEQNNLFTTGYSTSIDFPVVNAGVYYDNILSGNRDIIISKFNSAYSLKWSTLYGGSSDETGSALAIDKSGNIFITGYTNSTDFPCLNGGGYFDNTSNGLNDAFLLNFSNNGTIISSTYVGGNKDDLGYDIAIDNNSTVFLSGETNSLDFPVKSAGGYNDNSLAGGSDGFIMQFANSGSLLWSTFFGGSSKDRCNSICVDDGNNIFLTGTTASSNFPLQNNGTYFDNQADGSDFFISKFTSALNLNWSTFYGGSRREEGVCAAIDNKNNLIVTGITESKDFPTYGTGGSYLDNMLNNNSSTTASDVCIAKFNNNGTRVWATYFGGEEFESFLTNFSYNELYFNDALIADECGNIYLSFYTGSAKIITKDPGCNSYFDNNQSINTDYYDYGDCFISKFSKSNQLEWASYFGSQSDNEEGMPLAFDNNYNLIASGISNDDFGFPFVQKSPAYFDNVNNQQDCFLVKFNQPKFSSGINYANCSGGCNGAAEVILNSACQFGYKYKWSNGETSKIDIGLCSGTYSVIIIDTINCFSETLNFNLQQGIQIFPSINPYSCSVACTGSAAVAFHSLPNLNYKWSNGKTTSSINALCPGDYSVTVTEVGCGSASANFSISLPPPLTILINSLVAPFANTCTGNCNANATLVVSGGATGHSLVWSNGKTGTTSDSLCSGVTYKVTAADSLCYTTTIDVIIPPPPKFDIFTVSTLACDCNGSASVSTQFGSGSYSYLWSNGQTSKTATGLCPGNYSVTATDSKCGPVSSIVTIQKAVPIKITSIQKEGPYCKCDGTATVSINYPVVSPIIYRWSNGQKTNMATKLCADSTYYVTVTDACGNTDAKSIFIKPDSILIHMSSERSCPNSCNGTANVYSVMGGTPPYTYKWSNGQTTMNVINLCADSIYRVTVTDACDHMAKSSIAILPYVPPFLSVEPITYTCPGVCNGAAKIYVSGLYRHPSPYTYLWSNGGTDEIGYNLCPGVTYSISVSDFCGDFHAISYPFPLASAVHVDMGSSPSCALSCNGTAYTYVVGGIPPLNYVWSTGENGTLISNVCANTNYSITVSDACNSRDSNTVLISLAPPVQNQLFHSASACPNYCDGAAYVQTSGGTPPYLYHWSNGTVNSNVNNLCPGVEQSVIVFDPGCSLDTITFIIPSKSINASILNQRNNTCGVSCNGSAAVTVSPASPSLTYLWSNNQTTAIANQLCPGTYSVIVAGCASDTVNFTIGGDVPSTPTLNLTDTLICDYNCNAGAFVSVGGGGGNYFYLWSNGETNSIADSLCAGNQFVIIEEAGCPSDTFRFLISGLSNMNFSTSFLKDPVCYGDCNGAAELIVTGGIDPYTYLWKGGQTQSSATGLCSGENTVAVTDSLGCVKIYTIQLTAPIPIINNPIITNSHCLNADGSITLSPSGGISPYTYAWKNGKTDQTLTGLAPGNYSVTITDDSSCFIYDVVTLKGEYPELKISHDTTVFIGSTVPLSVSGALNYNWFTQEITDCNTCPEIFVSPLVTTTYCVAGEDEFGCVDTACVIINILSDCGEAYLPTAFSPNLDGHNDQYRVLGRCIKELYLAIYNRWGEKVFESADQKRGWDGTYKGEKAELGVYVYYLKATDLLGNRIFKKGNVTLLR